MNAIQLICILSFAALTSTALQAQGDGLDIEDLFEDDFEIENAPTINDPFEGLNRAIFNFNDGIYTHIATPLANTYKNVMPDPVEKGIGNVFTNLKFPSRFVGSLLQGKLKRAGQETAKFVINTTIGLGGIFKASDNYDLDPPKEDISQAFASWGIGHGFYVVVPILGPTSARDFIGDLADGAVEPIPSPWSQVDDSTARLAILLVEKANQLPQLINAYDSMSRSAIDKYAAVRDGYTQHRTKLVEE